MNITFTLTLLRWRISTFDVRIDIDGSTEAAAHPFVDRGVKGMSRWWTKRMAS